MKKLTEPTVRVGVCLEDHRQEKNSRACKCFP